METPQFFQPCFTHTTHFMHEKPPPPPPPDAAAKNSDHFAVEDLLNIPNDETVVMPDAGLDADAPMTVASTDSSSVTMAVDNSCNSSFSVGLQLHPAERCLPQDSHFSSDFCVPYDDFAELEWLSNFEEESIPNEDMQKLHLIQGIKARNIKSSATQQYNFHHETPRPCPILRPEVSVPAKARSKRSRAAPDNWSSRLLAVATPASPPNFPSLPSPPDLTPTRKPGPSASSSDGRKCLHCATDKTPQWRTGPMGPKTLCNACGVRYKSGRLVPEYRPAASPTFVTSKHSNSHRKVLELRRQKEVVRAQQQQFVHQHQNMMFDLSNAGDDFLIHQHIGPDFRHLL